MVGPGALGGLFQCLWFCEGTLINFLGFLRGPMELLTSGRGYFNTRGRSPHHVFLGPHLPRASRPAVWHKGVLFILLFFGHTSNILQVPRRLAKHHWALLKWIWALSVQKEVRWQGLGETSANTWLWHASLPLSFCISAKEGAWLSFETGLSILPGWRSPPLWKHPSFVIFTCLFVMLSAFLLYQIVMS